MVLTFDGRMSGGHGAFAGRFGRLAAAQKECARQNASAWFRVETPADLLRKGSFLYEWRVWDHWHRRFVEGATGHGR